MSENMANILSSCPPVNDGESENPPNKSLLAGLLGMQRAQAFGWQVSHT